MSTPTTFNDLTWDGHDWRDSDGNIVARKALPRVKSNRKRILIAVIVALFVIVPLINRAVTTVQNADVKANAPAYTIGSDPTLHVNDAAAAAQEEWDSFTAQERATVCQNVQNAGSPTLAAESMRQIAIDTTDDPQAVIDAYAALFTRVCNPSSLLGLRGSGVAAVTG
jgi:hypothetical protein